VHGGYGVQRQRAVDVREELGTTFEILVNDPTAQPRRIDLEQHQIRDASEETISDAFHLVRVRTVNEAFFPEASGAVLAERSRDLPLGIGCDVKEPNGVGSHLWRTVEENAYVQAVPVYLMIRRRDVLRDSLKTRSGSTW
jgi:hypothetical protein